MIVYAVYVMLAAIWAVWRLCPWCWSPFINHSQLTTEQITAAWESAVSRIATQPFPLSLGSAPDYQPADVRALHVKLRAVKIKEVNDQRPEGGFKGGLGMPGYYNGLTYIGWYRPTTVKIARSVAADVLGYELENVILYKLGYSTEDR